VKLDDDVHEELRKLAKRFGRPLGALANDALRDFVRYENHVAAAIDRGITDLEAGRTRTTEEGVRASRTAAARTHPRMKVV
jgi:predicted transcriptional regulator